VYPKIAKDDIYPDEIGVGNVVELEDSEGNKIIYTILGPWDTNPEDNIISYQAQFAQAMIGKKSGDQFIFRDREYRVVAIKDFLEP